MSRLSRKPGSKTWQRVLADLFFKDNERVSIMWDLIDDKVREATFNASAKYLSACYFVEAGATEDFSEDSLNIAGKLLLELWDSSIGRLARFSDKQASSNWKSSFSEPSLAVPRKPMGLSSPMATRPSTPSTPKGTSGLPPGSRRKLPAGQLSGRARLARSKLARSTPMRRRSCARRCC